MAFDLDSMSLKELKELQAQVTRAIASFVDRKKKLALDELESKARELGFSLAELTGASLPKKRVSAGAKYANPADASDTWSGRGRRPRWFEAALAQGKSADDLLI